MENPGLFLKRVESWRFEKSGKILSPKKAFLVFGLALPQMPSANTPQNLLRLRLLSPKDEEIVSDQLKKRPKVVGPKGYGSKRKPLGP